MMAVVLFVVVNPLLYVTPVERAIDLIRHRQDEMEFQRVGLHVAGRPGRAAGADRAGSAERAFDDYATPAGPLPVSPDVVLVAVGLALLAWRAVRELRRRGRAGAAFSAGSS